MTIYILDTDIKKTAECLDDKSLDKMIKSIANELCNVHYIKLCEGMSDNDIPLPMMMKPKWINWLLECKANYKYLVYLGISCDWELAHRNDFILNKKYHDIFEWTRENVPNLPRHEIEGGYDYTDNDLKVMLGIPKKFPLVMPKKYIEYLPSTVRQGENKPVDIIQYYRNYYQSKLLQKIPKESQIPQNALWFRGFRWTKREKPEWVKL